jgi:hypothetical protein
MLDNIGDNIAVKIPILITSPTVPDPLPSSSQPQPTSTVPNRTQPSSTVLNRPQPSSTVLNRPQPFSSDPKRPQPPLIVFKRNFPLIMSKHPITFLLIYFIKNYVDFN